MKRDKKLIERRAEYVKKYISTRPTTEGVKKLSKKLFISERTIWKIITGY